MSERPASERVLRWVGDLDHPFYDDERQRFVWYESSAIGFQMLLLLQYVGAGVTLLIFGREAWPSVAVMLGTLMVTTLLVIGYASRQGAQYFPSLGDITRSRAVAGVLATSVLAAGCLRASADGPADQGGFWGGFTSVLSGPTLVGALCGGMAIGLLMGALSRRSKDDEADRLD